MFDVRGPAAARRRRWRPRSCSARAGGERRTIRRCAGRRLVAAAGAARCTARLVPHGRDRRTGPPLLIVGAPARSAARSQRVCARARACARSSIGRAEVDIADPTRSTRVLRRVAPWAVINAAGYVRVDDAEARRRRVPARERRPARSTSRPRAGAASCRSSRSRPTWCSTARTRGLRRRRRAASAERLRRSKAEAERRVLDLLPDALVVRTSAFFGPWDELQLRRRGRSRALDAGARFLRPADTIVSPTYVPRPRARGARSPDRRRARHLAPRERGRGHVVSVRVRGRAARRLDRRSHRADRDRTRLGTGAAAIVQRARQRARPAAAAAGRSARRVHARDGGYPARDWYGRVTRVV